MAESHVVTGLVAKRAELAGRIEQCHRELERLVANMSYLDGSIKLFAPDYKLEGIRVKNPRQRNQFFHQGECQRLVLEIFRYAEEPPYPLARSPRPRWNAIIAFIVFLDKEFSRSRFQASTMFTKLKSSRILLSKGWQGCMKSAAICVLL